jgi:hypothetical protein
MSEKDKQAILDAAAKLQQGIDAQLENTAEDDHYLLQEHAEMYGGLHEQAGRITQAQYRQRLRNIRSNPQFMAKLKSRGLTPEKLVELEQAKPGAYGKAYDHGEDYYLDDIQDKIAKKGGDAFFDPGRSARPTPAQSAAAKKAAAKSKGDDDGVDAILAALLDF